jgi:hypothetical protein
MDPIGNLNPNTVVNWDTIDYYYEVFDASGRRKSLRHDGWNSQDSLGLTYRIEYEYTEDNNPLSTRYYLLEGDSASGEWIESTRINYTYNDKGNLALYERSFFNVLGNRWELEHRKEYYYKTLQSSTKESCEDNILITLFPNPVTDILFLAEKLTEGTVYHIIASNGTPLVTSKLSGKTISVEGLPPGFYFLQIVNTEGLFTTRFLKL